MPHPTAPSTFEALINQLLEAYPSVRLLSHADRQASFSKAAEAAAFAVVLHEALKGAIEVQVNLPRDDDSPRHPFVSWLRPGERVAR